MTEERSADRLLPAVAVGLVALVLGAGAGWLLQPVFFGDEEPETVASAPAAGAEDFVSDETVAPATTAAPETTAAPTPTAAPAALSTRYANPTRTFTVALPDDLTAQSGGLNSNMIQAAAQPDTAVENYNYLDRFLQVNHFPDPAVTVESQMAQALAPDAPRVAVCGPPATEPFTAGSWTGMAARFTACPGLGGYLAVSVLAPGGGTLGFFGSIGSPADEAALRAMVESIVFGPDEAAPVPDDRYCFAIPVSEDPASPLKIRFVNRTGLDISAFYVFEGAETPVVDPPNVTGPGFWQEAVATEGITLRIRVGADVVEVPFGPEPTKCVPVAPPG